MGVHQEVGGSNSVCREDDVSPSTPGAMTEFTVAVYRNPVEHKIRLKQVVAWT